MQQVKSWPPPSAQRGVRVERWPTRCFYAQPCRFFLDVPLDMSGMVLAATRDAVAHGIRPLPGGTVLATDAIYRGAILIEIEDPGIPLGDVIKLEGEVLARTLPDKGLELRGELSELVRWANDLGNEVTACYVRYESRGTIPGALRATTVYATIVGEQSITEPPDPPR